MCGIGVETPDGEVIDLTKDQYELNNNPVPSTTEHQN